MPRLPNPPAAVMRRLPLLVGLAIMLGTLLAFYAGVRAGLDDAQARGQRLADHIATNVEAQLAVLDGVRALHYAQPDVRRVGVQRYLEVMQPDRRAPGMQGVGFALATRTGDDAAVRARLREDYGIDRAPWPATDQAYRTPITLLEPANADNRRALGFDMFSEARRRDAMLRAWRSGRPAASDIVELVQDAGGRVQPGFLIYMPVVRPQGGVAGPDAPAVTGFVYAPYRVRDFIGRAVGPNARGLAIAVRAGDATDAAEVYRQGSPGRLARDFPVAIADHVWTVRVADANPFAAFTAPVAILLLGGLLALFSVRLLAAQRREMGTLQQMADEQARFAQDRQLMLGEMGHRLKNAFARIGALARITLRESDDLDDFEQRFDGRLQALSHAKQMLTTGSVTEVDLRAIVAHELQLAGHDDGAIAASTDLRLGDDAAQAMALALHELATNSVKYGALRGDGSLAVGWTVADGHVTLDWHETGLPDTPEIDGEGFGSSFVRVMIERQLRGQWTREPGDHALLNRIRWPHEQPAAGHKGDGA